MKNRRNKRNVEFAASENETKVTARRIHTPERDLPGHPIAVAIALAGLTAVILGVTLAKIEVASASFGSWTLFG